MFVELEQMAARPFGEVFLDVKRTHNLLISSGSSSSSFNVAPIALEPCSNGKAGVVTVFIKLPASAPKCSGKFYFWRFLYYCSAPNLIFLSSQAKLKSH